MSKGDTFENDLLKLIFNATPIANIADNAGSSPLANLYIALHTDDPGEGGSQTTNECNYSGYARQPLARTSGGFTVAANSVSPTANVNFPNPSDLTNLPQTAAFLSIGTALSGAGKVLYSGPLSPTIAITNAGSIPQVAAGTTITEN